MVSVLDLSYWLELWDRSGIKVRRVLVRRDAWRQFVDHACRWNGNIQQWRACCGYDIWITDEEIETGWHIQQARDPLIFGASA